MQREKGNNMYETGRGRETVYYLERVLGITPVSGNVDIIKALLDESDVVFQSVH